MTETLSDSREVTHMVYLVISSCLLSFRCLFFPTGHLSPSPPPPRRLSLPHHGVAVAGATEDICSALLSQSPRQEIRTSFHTRDGGKTNVALFQVRLFSPHQKKEKAVRVAGVTAITLDAADKQI